MSPILTIKRLISKDGTEIIAEATGDYSKPHIVFVHGGSSNGTVFDPIFKLAALTENLYLVRYDLRGHGRSGKPQRPEDYESIRYAEDFQAVLDAFKLKNPIYAGWSFGATVLADICAHISPLPISAALWIAPFAYLDQAPPPLTEGQLALFSNDAATSLLARIGVCAAFVAPGREVPFADMLGWIGSTAFFSPKGLEFSLSRKQNFAPLKKHAAAGLPLLFLYGSQDLILQTADELSANMKLLFTDLEIVVMEGIGHTPFWEDPKLFAEHTLRFVNPICK
ncbi:alpha/beta-hydrolase [Mycena rebaudengoi]|nr:alpha/beta-hydrolase [Mycena rebaudengoi]